MYLFLYYLFNTRTDLFWVISNWSYNHMTNDINDDANETTREKKAQEKQ